MISFLSLGYFFARNPYLFFYGKFCTIFLDLIFKLIAQKFPSKKKYLLALLKKVLCGGHNPCMKFVEDYCKNLKMKYA